MSTILQILKKNTLKNYEYVTNPFRTHFGGRELNTITSDEILPFFTELTNGAKQSTKKLRYANLKAFFNFIKNTFDSSLENPCEAPMLKKIWFHKDNFVEFGVNQTEHIGSLDLSL